MTIELSLLISGISVAFAIYFGISSKRRTEKKDVKDETKEETATSTMVMIKLDSIADDLKDIKRENKESRVEMQSLRERVVVLEQSLKSFHKRLDGTGDSSPK